MSDHDAELVALIDNELDEDRRTALLARLAADDGLRQRYEELRQTSVPLATSFGALLELAPLARLRAALPAGEAIWWPRRRFAGVAFRELAAGLVLGALAAGVALWAASTLGLFDGREDWRTAIAEYTHLYTNETFSPLTPDSAQQAAELKAVGAMVGATLTPENVALPGLQIHVGVHAFIRRLTDGRPCLCRFLGRSSPALHPRQRRAGRVDPIREARRFVTRLVVA